MATNSAAAGSQPALVFPPRGLEVRGNVSAAAFCNAGKDQFHLFSTYCDNLATALAADLTEMLRAEGLDGQRSIGPVTFGSDARSAARKGVRPLRTIAAEAENIAKAFRVLDAQMKAHVFDVIQEAQAAKERQKNGGGLKMGA